nr:RHS repeat-associated core domain-containing protein [Chryseobacterium sp.]
MDTNNYYPFGLNHIGQGKSLLGGYLNYKFQEQELEETGFYSFKWRNYMPDVGRFFNVDPLAEKYVYNSPYAFSENRVIDGRELEGLEWVKSITINQDNTKTYTLSANIKLANKSQSFTSQDIKDFQTSYINNMKTYNGTSSNGDKVEIGKINFEMVDNVEDGDYSISIVDHVVDNEGKEVLGKDGMKIGGMIQLDGKFSDPVNGYIGNSQQNNMQVVPNGKNMTGEAAAHEVGHSFGLRHNTDSDNPIQKEVKVSNLMHDPRMGNVINAKQRDIIIQNIPNEKSK